MNTASSGLQVAVEQKRFASHDRNQLALQGFQLDIAPREFVCLVGPSGCGKSTLINIINGLDDDYLGSVRLNGQTLAIGGSVQQRVATMFQTPRLMPWLTVLDNIKLVLDDDAEGERRALELLAAMGLGDTVEAYPNRLSGGMQRRVALARAFAIQPQLLLMDEPFVSLDLPTANRLRTMLTELWQRERAAVLFVTHDLREALSLADRVVFMSAGPGRVVLEQPLDLPRPRDPDSASVAALSQQLLRERPELLSGSVARADSNDDGSATG